MRFFRSDFRLPAIAVMAAAMSAGCPLPFDYNGQGAGSSNSADPSSPVMTVPVVVTYSEQGGTSGTIANGDSLYTGLTTTVTLSTTTQNAAIYYTDDGTPVTKLDLAKKIDGSSGDITVNRTTSLKSLDIHAIAIGPNMHPSPAVHAVVSVSPYPILSVTRDHANAIEDGGTAAFTISSSSTASSDITVNLQTSGDYEPGDETGLPVAGTTFTATLVHGTTTIVLPIVGQPDVDGENDTVTLTILPDTKPIPTYTVGAPASVAVVIQDNRTPVLTIAPSATPISDNGGTSVFTLTSSFAMTTDLTVNLQTGGTYEPADVTGIAGPGTSFAVTLPAGATTVPFPITAHPDLHEYDNETVTLSIMASPNYTTGSPGSATITITDSSPFPVLTVNAPGSIPDTNSATFTVTASVAPEVSLTVNLQTSGTYEPADVTGIGVSGSSFTVTLPAGATTATIPITAHPDLNEYDNESVTLSLVGNTDYGIGSPSSATVTIIDTSPIPVLTLTEDRTAMLDGDVATFTVTASVAPEVDLTVNILSSGYAPGMVSVPTSVTLPAGTTSRTFLVTTPSVTGYPVQNPVLSLQAGIGHTLGSPSTRSLVILDNVVGITYDGVWGFTTDTGSGVGSGASWSVTGNVTLGSGGLTFGGVYGLPGSGDDATVPLSFGSTTFDPSAFTFAVQCVMSDMAVTHSILVGGTSYRWLIAQADTAGNLVIELNNHAVHLPLGMSIAAGLTNTLVLNFNAGALTLTAWLNGNGVTLPLPPGFVLDAPSFDYVLSGTDFSSGRAFEGTWNWVFAVNGLLSSDTVVGLAASSGL
jgi:hypothetical protein